MEKNGKKFIEEGLVKHHNQLLGYAMSLTHDADDAQDLLQDIALHALKKADQYQEKGMFCAWAKRTMRNRFLNKERDEKLRQTTGYDDISPAETPCTVAEADSNIDYCLIKDIISTLPHKQATRFIRATEGYSYAEIAREDNTSISSVKSYIHTARNTLRGRIGGL